MRNRAFADLKRTGNGIYGRSSRSAGDRIHYINLCALSPRVPRAVSLTRYTAGGWRLCFGLSGAVAGSRGREFRPFHWCTTQNQTSNQSLQSKRGIRLPVSALALLLCFTGAAENSQKTSVLLDDTSKGRVFDGIGTVSAGASSRLLVDYPEPQRNTPQRVEGQGISSMGSVVRPAAVPPDDPQNHSPNYRLAFNTHNPSLDYRDRNTCGFLLTFKSKTPRTKFRGLFQNSSPRHFRC